MSLIKPLTVLAILLVGSWLDVTVFAATYTVTNISDAGPGSLRQALADAKVQTGTSTVVFAPALSGQTITLASTITVNDTFGPTIDVTIDATSLPSGLTISGNNANRIFGQGNSASSLTLRRLALVSGKDNNAGGAISATGALTLLQCTLSGNFARYAGAINYSGSALTITQCTLSGNKALDSDSGAIYIGNNCTATMTQCMFSGNSTNGSGGYGGAINLSSGNTLTLTQCTFTGNSTGGSWGGGAIYNSRSAVTMTECVFSGNAAGGSGGAIVNDAGTMILTRCTFSGNSTTGGYGGAIENASGTQTLTLKQCTLAGNFTGSNGGGGAISSGGSSVLEIVQCTISGNTAGSGGGGGIYHWTFGTMTMTNSIVAGNNASIGTEIRHDGGTIIRAGANLIGSNDTATAIFSSGLPNTSGDYVGTSATPLNPQVAPLANNGGLTQTMALLPGSLARDHATLLSPPFTADQRGRPILYKPDIGALENQFGVVSRPLLIPDGSLAGSVLCTLETDGLVTANSSNATLIPNENVAVTGSGLSRTITITPTAGRIGSSTLVLTHSPSGDTDTFEVYVLPANYVASSIDDIGDQTINEDSGTLSIPFSVTDSASVFGLSVNFASSNTALVPNASIIAGGTGANRHLAVTPTANESGSTTLTVTVSDGATSASDTFLLTVNSVNDAPSFVKGADQITSSSVEGQRSVGGWATALNKGPSNESSQTLSFIVTNDNNALFSVQPAVSATGTLTYTPATGVEGTTTVSVRLQDSGGTANGGVDTSDVQTFTVRLVTSTTPTLVTSMADSGSGSLREMVSIAAAKTGADVITFSPALSGKVITLAGQITTTDASGVTIDATTVAGGLTISGNNATRVFRNSGVLTLRGLKISGGNGVGSSPSGTGGAIYNSGTLMLTQCTLSGNAATSGAGGAIHNSNGVMTLTQCTFSGNTTTSGSGGAIYNSMSATPVLLTLTQCTLSGNSTASGSGGAIYNNIGTAKLTQCTLSGNSAGSGGAIFNNSSGLLTLINSIVAANSASTGADIYLFGGTLSRSGVNLIGKNSTITSAFPAGSPNVNGNYVGTTAVPLNPQLAPLGNYGGLTQTMALLPGSVARDHATVLSPVITADQRAFPIVGTPDVGAYESGTTNNFTVWSLETVGIALTFAGDNDHDGQLDGLEYATRMNPSTANGAPLAGPVQNAGGAMEISFPYRIGATDLRYLIQRSTDLVAWMEVYRYDANTGIITEVGVTADENFLTQIITITDPVTSPASFWRLCVELAQ